ncbi:MAG TPA: lanthionine synthetase LanC family protein [Pyrinomonadaceae bacterium]|jgi:lantibiotic modifying enzyme
MSVQTDVRELALQAAGRIGRSLCASAFWDEASGQCTWMGRTDVEDASGAGYASATAALAAHLYGGTAGVALFLGELYAQTEDKEVRRTAEGALRRSVSFLRRHEEGLSSPLSFFLAHLGGAYVGARLLDFGLGADLRADLDGLLDQAAAALAGEHLLDVLGGSAGAIPALLALARRPGFERCLALARACGEDLCRTALRDGEVACWEATKASGEAFNSPPMTGLSHGACGMALALFELYAHTGEREFLETARAAFAYEDRLFNPTAGNWLDVRFPSADYGEGLTGTYQATWCHGAAGIALTRVRAMVLDPERAAAHEQMARVALNTTLNAIAANVQAPRFDATLCHGLAGLSEIVLICAEAFDDDNYRQTSADITAELIQRYDAAGDWPSGNMTGGVNPTLMIGTAGIGHHFLRLCAPRTVPPVLIIQTSSAAA